jgi:hypothetical protein
MIDKGLAPSLWGCATAFSLIRSTPSLYTTLGMVSDLVMLDFLFLPSDFCSFTSMLDLC